MAAFIVIAIALTIAAVAVVVVPLLRRRSTTGEPAIWAAFGAAGVLVFGAGALYLSWTNWSWNQPKTDASGTPQGMVSNLARRLERNPEDIEGWLMLGRSYAVLEQYELSERAYQRADRLAGGKNAEALVGMAEALIFVDEKEIDGRAGQYIEKALVLDPKSGKALFYGAAAAMRRNELQLARERFSNLLALNPPENVRPVLQQQIAAIDAKLNGTAPPVAANQGTPQSRSPATSADGKPSATQAAPPVRVKVTLSAKLSSEVPSSAPLFVLVRDPRQAGPPLAVKRLTSHFPQTVELTTADSMLPGHSYSAGQLVEVVARVSRSGSPIGVSGDPFGLAAHKVGEGGVVDIVIDHVTP
jgi:cytochrome c-type biogenesis protein CcmH